MEIKKNENHQEYIKLLRSLSPEKRLLKSFELNEFAKKLFITGLKKRFPDLSDKEIKKIYLKRLEKCFNRNY
jgi:hypothetical protein